MKRFFFARSPSLSFLPALSARRRISNSQSSSAVGGSIVCPDLCSCPRGSFLPFCAFRAFLPFNWEGSEPRRPKGSCARVALSLPTATRLSLQRSSTSPVSHGSSKERGGYATRPSQPLSPPLCLCQLQGHAAIGGFSYLHRSLQLTAAEAWIYSGHRLPCYASFACGWMTSPSPSATIGALLAMWSW